MSEFTKTTLRDVLLDPISGSRPKGGVNNEGEVPSLGGENITMSGGIKLYPIKKITSDFFQSMQRGHLKDLDVLINKDGANTGKSGIYRNSPYLNAAVNEHIFILRGKEGYLEQEYLHYLLQLPSVKAILNTKITGSAQPGLNSTFVKNFPIELAPIPEQKKIASILTSVDEVIEKTQSQIYKLQDLKKGMMNELLTKGIGHTEFKDSELGRIPKSWEVKSICELYKDTRNLTSDSNEIPLYSLTIENGLVTKPDRYIRDFLIIDTSKDNYKLVKRGDLVMNPMNLRWGAISAHYGEFDVCVSKYYNVLSSRERQTSTLFYEALFQSKRFLNMYEKIATGTLEEKKRVHWSDFQRIKIPVPPILEQERIENKINKILAHILSVTERNSKYKSLKKSLIQNLLTGKVRVNITNG